MRKTEDFYQRTCVDCNEKLLFDIDHVYVFNDFFCRPCLIRLIAEHNISPMELTNENLNLLHQVMVEKYGREKMRLPNEP